MFEIILSFFVAIRVFFRSRSDTALEVLALRQQIAVLKRKRPRPKLNSWDRLFWTTLRQCWSRWSDVVVLVKPDTVVGWHRAGFLGVSSKPQGGYCRLRFLHCADVEVTYIYPFHASRLFECIGARSSRWRCNNAAETSETGSDTNSGGPYEQY